MPAFRKREERVPPKVSFEIKDSDPPAFSLRFMQPNFCISRCTKDEKAAFAGKLRELSQLSWQQLRSADRHGMGYEVINRNSIRTGIPSHVTEDVRLIAFRFDGLKPMVGYRDSGIFFILWLDRSFTLYPHG